MPHRRVLVLLCVLVAVLAPGVARSAGTISGTVLRLEGGSPIADAVVTVAGPGQPPVTTRTDADGRFSIDVPGDGPYGVGVQSKGFANEAVPRVSAGELAPVALRPAEYTPLPVFDGRGSVVADAASGTFYALIGFAPEVYRTVDYGGSWQPVTMSYDDPGDGLRNSPQHKALATSGVPGEVAVVSEGGTVFFSTDYGITWRTVSGLIPPVPVPGGGIVTPTLFWGHAGAGAPNVLLVAQPRDGGGSVVWRADMSADAPGFNEDAADPFGAGSAIGFADSRTGSFAGRVNASGELSFAPLTAGGPIVFGPVEASGLPTPPRVLRLGGTEEDAAPPDGALVVGGVDTAQMLTKAAGAASFTGDSVSAPASLPGDCRAGSSPSHTIAPTSGGTSGAGSSGACWLRKNGTDLSVVQAFPEGGPAYDADWGRSNHVAFMSGAAGIVKSARLNADGVPIVPAPDRSQPAQPGPGEDSAGVAVTGITSPDVRDTVYGPRGSSDVAVAVTDLSLASRDGGASVTAVGSASNAVQWWPGASGEWLVFGHAACGGLTAALDWDAAAPRPTAPVTGSTCPELGLPAPDPSRPGSGLLSLQPVPETDTLFFGFGGAGGGAPHIYRGRLVAGDPPASGEPRPVSLTDVVSLDPDPAQATLHSPHALAYCPDRPSTHGAMRDVLFVATGGGGGPGPAGSLLRITRASGPSPAVGLVDSVPQDSSLQDVRADCATGFVYTGGTAPNVGALYRSDDGGQTFLRIDVPGPGSEPLPFVTAIGLSPANGKDVKVAALGGAVVQSSDAGTTWTLVSDPAVDRPIAVHDIEIPPAGGAASRVAQVAPPALALVGTASGVYQGAIAARSGVLAVRGGRALGAQLSELRSDDHPTVAPAGGGRATSVFRRSNGLYQARSISAGSWSLPTLVPGTDAGDDFPAAVLGASGRLRLAFARAGAAPGIYVATREASGTWSTPRRVSSSRGDTLPAIAVSGARVDIAFLRTRGRARGIYYVSGRAGRFGRAARIRGTGAADARAALGGPALAARAGRLHLAFGRRRGRAGIYYAARRGSRWTAPRRLTRARGDDQPALVAGASGAHQIVFRRRAGSGRGLFALRGERRWALTRIRGTTRADTEPALARSGPGLVLAFARPAGRAAGVYVVRGDRRGRWRARPVRSSGSAADRNPSVSGGRVTIVFERG